MLIKNTNLLAKLASQQGSVEVNERERLRALYAIGLGHSVEDVAKIFTVDDATIYRWIKQWNDEKTLEHKPKDGRPTILDESDREELKRLIEENNPKEHGVNTSVWDCTELQKYFQKKGIAISIDAIRVCLKNMGAHYVKSQLTYTEADKQRQLEFAKLFVKEMKHKPDDVVVMFEDEMSAESSARTGYGWTFDKRLVVTAPQNNVKRLNCFGAVNPFDGLVIEHFSSNAKSTEFIKLLKKLSINYANKTVWIYLDNGPVHRSKKVKQFLSTRTNIVLKPLPPYSPDLNPQEHWHFFKRLKLLNNQSFDSLQSLAGAMHSFARNTASETIKMVCSLQHIYTLAGV